MQTHKLIVEGVGIQIEDHGGPGEAVLFLHYGGSNLRMWDPVVPFFVDVYRCITLDLRGHGRSDAPATGYHIDDMARDVVGILDVLGIEQTHIIGSSIGAEIGLSVAAHYPERMRSLVAEGALHSEYGPYGTRDPESFDHDEALKLRLEERKATPEKTYVSCEELLKEKRGFYKENNLWNPAVEAMLTYGAAEDVNGQIVDAGRKHASDAYMETYFNYRFEEYYTQITCPILMLPDEKDAADDKLFDIMTRLSQLPKQCEIVRVPGAMYPFGWMLDPEPVANAALDFFNQLA